jgi:cytochrome c oxidase assembly factor CtaG
LSDWLPLLLVVVDLWVAVPLGLAVVVYVRGWRRLHRRVPQRFGAGCLAAFVGGMVAIGVALESPLHALGAQWLQAHMVQHLVLMMVAPPLLWLGAPLLPMLSGLPKPLLHRWVGALFAWPPLTRLGQWLVRPAVAWAVFAERVIYPSYAAVSRPWGISTLTDQAAAGAIMWVPGSIAFLVPVAWMVGQLLSPKGSQIIGPRHQPMVDGG